MDFHHDEYLELRRREISIQQTNSDTFSQVLDEFRRIRMFLEKRSGSDTPAIKKVTAELKASEKKLSDTIKAIQTP